MLRPLPLLLLGLLSGVVAVVIGFDPTALLPRAGWLPLPDRGAGIGWAAQALAAAGTGLAFFVLLGLLVPAVAEAIALGGLRRRLRRLARRLGPAEEFAAEKLRDAFSRSPFAAEAASYASALWRDPTTRQGEEASGWRWRSTLDPEPLFRSASRDRVAAGQLAGHLALLIAAAGAIPLLGARYAAGTASVAALSGGPSPSMAEPLAWVLLAVGAALFVLARCFDLIRLHYLTEITAAVRGMFPPAPAEFLAQQLVIAAQGGDESRMMAVGAAGDALKTALGAATDEIKTMLGSHDRRIAASVASSVQRAIQPIAISLQATLERLETRHEETAQRLLTGVLAQFLGEFQERFGVQALALGDVLTRTKALADELHGTFAEAEARLRHSAATLGERMLDGVGEAMGTAVAEQTEALQAALGRIAETVSATEAGIERLGLRTDAALESWSARTNELGTAMVTRASEELKRTAATFGQLHAILETLSISVLPAINRLIQTQERLQAAIDADRQISQSMSAAAADLAQAVRVAHEMVERQMMLTRDLAQLRPAGEAGPLAAAPVASDLAQAIEDLRFEADRDHDLLPRL